jgi:2-iminobutanoate/2-iminopropanoate deaminase
MKTKITTDKAPAAVGPYSQAIDIGNLVFLAGQIYLTPEGVLLEGTKEEQIHQVMKNLEAVLKDAGMTFANVVKTTIFITNMSQYPLVNEIYGSYLVEPFPARETVGVANLPKGAWLEISVIAART